MNESFEENMILLVGFWTALCLVFAVLGAAAEWLDARYPIRRRPW